MARCGIRLRYPVMIVTVCDDGTCDEEVCIGEAETLGQALVLAEDKGFQVRDASDGGNSRFASTGGDSGPCFHVTVYPEEGR